MVRVEDGDGTGVVLVTLDRPERRNAVDHATLLALLEVQEVAAERGDVRAMVLTGAPPAFCAGADLQGVESGVFAADLHRVLRGFTALRFPVIAAIDGPALGAGVQLAAACDLRMATPSSVLGVPAARLGLVVDQWTVDRIARELGWSIARGMLVAAERYEATRLHAAGAVHRLGTLDDALTWAAEIARLAPLTMAGHKLALEVSAGPTRDDPAVTTARELAWSSADADEGRRAFLEKRPAIFRGE
jgi:enoyl-CoA hydratase